jgi:O-acetylhomoserine (thiol)-lyase
MSDEHFKGFATQCIHAGQQPDPATGARVVPIYQTTSYVFENAEHAANLFALKEFGNIYTRIMNPTQGALEAKVAALEGGTAALATASGHAAQMLILHCLMHPGDEFIAARQLYGGSINQFNHSFKQFGWHVVWADADDADSFRKALSEKTKAIFIESIANPSGQIVDIEAIAKVAEETRVPLIVDNTMATPYLIRPFEHGANVVSYSTTKFMNGHGNSMGGMIVDGGNFDWSVDGKYPLLTEPNPSYNGLKLHETFGNMTLAIAARVLGLRDLGPAMAPLNAFLTLTGLETLPLRMQRHCDNALKVAEWLEQDKRVAWVKYSGLKSSPYYELHRKYCPKGAGSVFTFGLKGGYDAGVKLVNSVKLFSHLANIGDVRSLIIHPASTTHSQLTEEQLIAAGAGPEVIRVSIGIEDVEDLIADLDQAMS